MGELEGPAIWKLEFRPDANRHIVLIGTPVVAGARDFFAELRRKIADSREKQALVFIHGFNTTFTDAARRTAQIAYDLGFDGVAAFYSWPSHGSLSPLGYNSDVRNADLTVAQFKQFLTDLSGNTQAKTIHLIAHSMGNRVLTRALSEMSLAASNARFRKVILMAPDIDAGLFRQLAVQMKSQAGEITLYASSRDLALKASETYAGYPRAGEGGNGIVVMPGLITIDASDVDTSLMGALHQYYGDSRAILSDVFALLQGRPPDQRFGLKRVEKQGNLYWIFKP